jgi:indole-3-glycerol phosphate synthase
LIPRLKRADPDTGRTWPGLDLVAMGRQLDDTDVGALAVTTAGYYGASIGDLLSVAEAITAPVLRDDLCLHRLQVYQARLHGADAVIIPFHHAPEARRAELVETASSTHMASVIEVTTPDEVDAALSFSTACIGIHCPQADGYADLARIRAVAHRIPRPRTVIVLSEVATMDDLWSLNGLIDAAVVGDLLLDAADPEAFVGAWQQRNA